jgi:hypothetical protein
MRRRLLALFGAFFGVLVVAPLLALAAYDLFVFQGHRPDIDKLLGRAGPAEQRPPESLARVLRVSPGDHLTAHVARQLLWAFDTAPRGGSGWHAAALAWWLLCEVHLTQAQRTTLFLSLAPMGGEEPGFERAASRLVGVPLAEVSVEQAAWLVAVAQAPSREPGHEARWTRNARRLAEQVRQLP